MESGVKILRKLLTTGYGFLLLSVYRSRILGGFLEEPSDDGVIIFIDSHFV